MSVFSDISEYVWDLLNEGKKLGISIGEETISDLILLEIARRNYDYLTIKKTSKNEESRKGIDWEWWIGNTSTGWIRYAVQAKKMDCNQYSYKKLKHIIGKNGVLQHEVLQDYAKNTLATALYAFFNYPKEPNLKEYWHCKKEISKKKMGITIAELTNIIEAINQKRGKNFPVIHKYETTYPLRCLLECISTHETLIFKGFPQKSVGLVTSFSIDSLTRNCETIKRNKIHDKDINLNYIMSGYDLLNQSRNSQFFEKNRRVLYPDDTIMPQRILVIDTELLNKASEK